jgi:hypothetical protein
LFLFLQKEMTIFLKLPAFHFSAAIVCVQKQCTFLGKQFFHQLLFHGLLTGLSTHSTLKLLNTHQTCQKLGKYFATCQGIFNITE